MQKNIEEIYEKYSQIVYKYIFCLTRNHELSEEIVQDTFLVAINNIDKFEGKSKFSTWLCAIAKNIYYKKIRKEKKFKKISIEYANKIVSSDIVEDIICENEEKLEIIKKFQKLDEETRNVMYLRIYADLSYDEIAEILGKTSSWARVTFFRGKEKIKENLKRRDNKDEKRM